MRRFLALLLMPAIAVGPAACRQQPQGPLKVVVIGGEPRLRDPALGPLSPPDAVLLENIAQGLVRFDAAGNIVPGLAERWNVSDDGLSYIFRLSSRPLSDGTKINAAQVARLLKRQLGERSSNALKDPLGAVDDIVAMTDRVVEIRLLAPRPNLLALLAQPEFAILRGRDGTGPFTPVWTAGPGGEVRMTREVPTDADQEPRREQVLLIGQTAGDAVASFAAGKVDLVLGGQFPELPLVRRFRLRSDALVFDPAAGLFGLAPRKTTGALATDDARRLLAEAIDRANFVAALGISGLAPRATLLESGLDGIAAPTPPPWFAVPLSNRLPMLRTQADRLFGKSKPTISIALPAGTGSDLLLAELQRDWGALGLKVERAAEARNADFALIDEVAPSSSPSWFIRRFRCEIALVCDPKADELMDAARQSADPAQRYALLGQAAARIESGQLFIPITAPIRWSLVSPRIQNFAGNRYGRHTLIDLEQRPNGE